MKKFLKDLLNVPNSMSLLRLVATPSLAFFWFYMEIPEISLILGTVAGLTDLFDGLAARKLNQVTALGALIDHLGDLVFESTCLLIGLMIGSLRVLWPGPLGVASTALDAPGADLPAALVATVAAFLAVPGIDALGRRLSGRSTADELEDLTADYRSRSTALSFTRSS